MTFIGPLMMYDNISVTVYGALDHVHIFSDFRFVNVYQMTQMRVKPDSLVSPKNNHLHWQIEGPTNFVYKGSEICWPK